MRILITSNYIIDSETGTAKVALELAKQLSYKHKVIFICVGKNYTLKKLDKNLTIVKIPSIEINKFNLPLITPFAMFKVFKYLDRFKPQLVHAQNPFLISSLAQMWAKLNKIPFIVTFHHIPTEPFDHLFPKISKTFLSKTVQELYKNTSLKSFLAKCDAVIALNRLILESVKEVNKKIIVKTIPNGIDLSQLIKIRPSFKPDGNVRFVFLGSYNERKNQKFLVKVFSHLPKNYILNLYGNKDTNDLYFKSLEKRILKLKVKNVFLNGFIDTYKAFSKSDFLVSSSRKEAQSLVVIESLAAGKPIIGIENETISDLVDGSCGLVFPATISAQEFAKNLLQFTKNVNYIRLSKKSRKESVKFKIENVVSKIENLYQSLT